MHSSGTRVFEEGSARREAAGRACAGHADPHSDRPARGSLILQAVGLVAVLAAVNAVAGQGGFATATGGGDRLWLVLTPAFGDHLAWLNTWLGAALLLTAARVARDRWSQALRWGDLGISLLGLLVLLRMLVGGPILGNGAHWMAAPAAETLRAAGRQLLVMNLMLRVVLAGILLTLIAGLVRKAAVLVQIAHVPSWDLERAGRYLAGLALGLGLTAPAAILLGKAACLGPALPLGLALGAVLDRHAGKVYA